MGPLCNHSLSRDPQEETDGPLIAAGRWGPLTPRPREMLVTTAATGRVGGGANSHNWGLPGGEGGRTRGQGGGQGGGAKAQRHLLK